MPPKTNLMEAMNVKLDQLFEEVSSFKKEFREILASKDRQISDLKIHVSNMNDRITKLEDRIADGDSKMRENNVILSGQDLPESRNGESCVEVVRSLFQQKLNLVVPTADIVSAERIGKQNATKKNILIKMKNLSGKLNIIKSCKSVKPSFYANDDLPAEKQTILYVVRQAKKKFPEKISGCSSNGGRLFAYMKPEIQNPSVSADAVSNRNRRVQVSNLTKLKAFCNNELGSGLENFIQTWPY